MSQIRNKWCEAAQMIIYSPLKFQAPRQLGLRDPTHCKDLQKLEGICIIRKLKLLQNEEVNYNRRLDDLNWSGVKR